MVDEKHPYEVFENLPIPTYEEATSRPTSSQARLGPEEISDDAERQGLLGNTNRREARPTSRYEPPTVDSARSSLDFLQSSPGGSRRSSTEGLRREIEQMEVEDPQTEAAAQQRSLLSNRLSKRITSLTNTFSSIQLPFREYLPSIDFLRDKIKQALHSDCQCVPIDRSGGCLMIGRLFGAFLVVTIIYVLFVSDIFTLGGRRNIAQMYDPESVRVYVQGHTNEYGNIEEYLEYITKYPHIAGTEGNFVLAEWVEELFKAAGLEDVSREQFDVYLNYPRKDGRRVAIIDPPEKRWEAKIEEEQAYIVPSREQTMVFHGHSASGNVTGPLIYANYGSREDFKFLEDEGISLNGSIALVRYYGTQGDRALKVKAAELAGAAGCIIYSDPAEDGFRKGEPYPDGRYMPSDGVQRGAVSLMSWVLGDVLSPGFASTPGTDKRIKVEDSAGLNKIPSIPIAWRDAQPLLQSLKDHGHKVPYEWIGGVPDVQWWTGDRTSPIVNLMNIQDEEPRQPIYNVLGQIAGYEQPDKKIVVGNHRDAWCFGAADPGSGTAVMLEIVRLFGDLKKLGWRPARTIEFASWDGEEYNLIGSTEHVEDHIDDLRLNGYAYVNVDVAVSGHDFRAAASPLFETALLRVLDRTTDPFTNETLRTLWDANQKGLQGLGAGSDYVAFQDLAGTSSIDISFGGSAYPYHSCYDNFEWMKTFGDPGFEYHKVMGQIWALLILELSDRPVLPFDMEIYASAVSRYVNELQEYANVKLASSEIRGAALDLQQLRDAAVVFGINAKDFHDWDRAWKDIVYGSGGFESNVMAIKRMSHNSRMANFETHLLDLEEGGGVSLPTRYDNFLLMIF